MLVKNLVAICKLAGRISNPSSLTDIFRSIQLGPNSMQCCSEFGNMAIILDTGTGLKTPRLLNMKSVTAVGTLPPNSEITFNEQETYLEWMCGTAKGKWNYVLTDHKIPDIEHDTHPWTPQENLGEALKLACSACQAASVAAGLYGISVEVVGDKLYLMSCNTVSLAATTIEKGSFPVDKIVLRPPVPEIIAGLTAGFPDVKMDITDKGIFIQGKEIRAQLPLSFPLDQDLKVIYDRWTSSAEHVAQIDTGAIRRFIARARILSDRHTSFTIAIKVKDGKLTLSHSGISSSAEEYFIAEGIDPTVTFTSIQDVETDEEPTGVALSADILLQALGFVEEAVFDYLPTKKTLILRGKNPNFVYVVGAGK